MQAITTKPLKITDAHLAPRIKAECHSNWMVWDCLPGKGPRENHKLAAQALAEKNGWIGKGYGRLISGEVKNGMTVHVFEEGDPL